MDIITLFCQIDDFYIAYEQLMASHQFPTSKQPKRRGRPPKMHISEVMTILVAFHQSGFRTFKHFYIRHVCQNLLWAFPQPVSYNRFVELTSEALVLLSVYLTTQFGKCSGISFIDSTTICVCHNRRIRTHRVFDGTAKRSKNSIGWFFGFKLHIVINECGELLSIYLTQGNTDDRKPVEQLTQGLFGKLYGDKGYISKDLRETLEAKDLSLVTKVRKNMKPQPLSTFDALMLKHRMLIETVIGQLKSETVFEHTRHRSIENFQVNLLSALIAYTYKAKKPSLDMEKLHERKQLSDSR